MPKYKKCPDCGGMMKYHSAYKEGHEATPRGTSTARAATDCYVCTNKNCGKSYPASPDEKKAYGREYPKPGK